MARILGKSASFLLLMVMTSYALAGDLKYTQRLFYGNGPTHDTVYYLKGERKRIDSRSYVGGDTPDSFIYGPHTAMIVQCDLNRILQVNLDAKKYFVHPFKTQPFRATGLLSSVRPAESNATNPSHSQQRVIRVEETGDKKQFHNHEAWLVMQTIESTIHYEGNTSKSTSVDESWYIDLDAPMNCQKESGIGPNKKVQGRLSADGENVTETRTGSARIGFPISQRHRVTSLPGSPQSGMDVVEWSEEPLDPKLFEVPEGFTETKEWKDIDPQLGNVSRPTGMWENFLQWAKHLFNAP